MRPPGCLAGTGQADPQGGPHWIPLSPTGQVGGPQAGGGGHLRLAISGIMAVVLMSSGRRGLLTWQCGGPTGRGPAAREAASPERI